MQLASDLTQFPSCTQQECGNDDYGPYHGVNCARSRFLQDNIALWWD